jgi:hypothetical protein
MQLSKAMFSSDTYSSDSSRGLSSNNDSNTVCEPYCADALVKHIIGQDCQYMSKISLILDAQGIGWRETLAGCFVLSLFCIIYGWKKCKKIAQQPALVTSE